MSQMRVKQVCHDCRMKKEDGGRPDSCEYCKYGKRILALRAKRAAKREALMACEGDLKKLEERGYRICPVCKAMRHLSEFSTNRSGGEGKPHKVCDRCLTLMYTQRADKEFGKNFWRKKAYGMNSVARRILAKKRNVPVASLTLNDLEYVCKPQDLAALYDKQDGKCCYCGAKLTAKTVSCDHETPLSRGGKHALENLALCCLDCNYLKLTRTADEFRTFAKEYARRFLSEAADKEPQR